MNIKGNLKYVCTGSVIFLIAYMFVAALPMGSDIYFEPAWTRDISAPATASPAEFAVSDREAFILANHFGYFTGNGTILSSATSDGLISASPDLWAVYSRDARNTIVRHPDGAPAMTIPGSGFVHLDEDRTFLMLPGGDGVSHFSADGALLWTREHTAPLTAFNSSPAGTILGYADGLLVCVDPAGKELFSFYPGGSDLEVILGASISEDGSLVACVSGQDRQRFVLISLSGGHHKVIHHEYLEGNLTRQAFVDFEKKGHFVFFESKNGLGIVDCRSKKSSRVPVSGEVVAIGDCPGDALFVVLSHSGSSWTLSAIERPDHLVASTNFTAQEAFLVQRNEAIYLGMDSQISRINIRGIE